jgi:hypothetical protein
MLITATAGPIIIRARRCQRSWKPNKAGRDSLRRTTAKSVPSRLGGLLAPLGGIAEPDKARPSAAFMRYMESE